MPRGPCEAAMWRDVSEGLRMTKVCGRGGRGVLVAVERLGAGAPPEATALALSTVAPRSTIATVAAAEAIAITSAEAATVTTARAVSTVIANAATLHPEGLLATLHRAP